MILSSQVVLSIAEGESEQFIPLHAFCAGSTIDMNLGATSIIDITIGLE
jgi:hypothetical protein